jgi:diguanylate cyclase (GGDEF)-like protein/PAS domain S-box-containing protein
MPSNITLADANSLIAGFRQLVERFEKEDLQLEEVPACNSRMVEPLLPDTRTIGDLIGSESRFRRLADSGIIGIFEGNGSGQILTANAAFLQMLGYTPEDLRSGLIRWDRMTAPGYEQISRRFGEQLNANGSAAPAEVEYLRKDGSRVPVLVGLASLKEEFGEDRAIGFMLDLTHETKAQEALRKSEEQFRQLAENIREVFWMMDVSATTILYVSPAYEQVWGQTCESVYANPKSWMDSIHPEDRRPAWEIFARQLKGEIVDNEYRIVQPSGAIRWIRDRAFPIRDAAGSVVRLTGVAEDTTDRKLSELRLVHQAQYDDLTDLPNRSLFRERLEKAVAVCETGKYGAVFFIGLDEFKLVNDTLGHFVGDRLLKEVAKRLLAVCGASGTLARFGGDEFTLVAAGFDDPDAARHLGDRLIGCLEEPFRIEDRDVFIGARIGISLFPKNGIDPYVLKREANVAMHEAKRAGKNQIRFFTPEFADAALERLDMETRLRKALARSEFKLQFQPQFPPGNTHPDRFEALVRWCPPGGTPIPPVNFIPLAEQNGLIVPIGTWILHEACRRCAAWQRGNLRGVGVAVNVSAIQFACPDFVEIVAGALASTGLPPHLLEVELTESVFVQDVREPVRKLAKLRNLGVTIALDDFGTGYSSLSYLQNLPIDTLKLDRTFLLQSESRPEGAAVMRCVVELAHTLGLRVVGEGVETSAQLDFLSGLGCDRIQGFLLGRPSFDVVGAEANGNPVCPGADAALQESTRACSR